MTAPITSMTIDDSRISHLPLRRACSKPYFGGRVAEAGNGNRQATATFEGWTA